MVWPKEHEKTLRSKPCSSIEPRVARHKARAPPLYATHGKVTQSSIICARVRRPARAGRWARRIIKHVIKSAIPQIRAIACVCDWVSCIEGAAARDFLAALTPEGAGAQDFLATRAPPLETPKSERRFLLLTIQAQRRCSRLPRTHSAAALGFLASQVPESTAARNFLAPKKRCPLSTNTNNPWDVPEMNRFLT